MTDNITLPRDVALQIREALRFQIAWNGPLTHKGDTAGRAIAALDAALAEPERHVSLVCPQCNWTLQEQEPEKERAETVIPARCVAGSEKPASQRDESYRTTEPPAKPEPVAWMYVNLEGECEQIEYGTPSIDDDSITLLYAAPPAAAEPEPVHPGYVIGAHWLETAYSRIAAGEAEADVLAEVLGARGWVKPEPATVEQVIAAHGPSWGPSATADFFTGFRAAERFHGITKGDKT